MKKGVWITVLDKARDEASARTLHQAVGKYGLAPAGHFWQDRLQEMAWSAPLEELLNPEISLWIILGSAESLASETIRYGLSLLGLGVQSRRGHGFPIMLVVTGGEVQPETLPTPLKGADVLPMSATLGPKIVAKANMPQPKVAVEYRLDVYGVQGIGQWFEVGPPPGQTWSGVMFGVAGGDINAHGVGPADRLPERSVLEYPMKGLKIEFGDRAFTAWAVKNQLTDQDSYYLRVVEFPSALLFGPMSEGDDAEVFVVTLK
ncbi:MAG: hypothetical protein KKB20_06855 [Proteobacteria bacterium]|nr:hypothetical protein [Pseudomonadota bacterium]